MHDARGDRVTLLDDEQIVIRELRSIKLHKHGQLIVEVSDGKAQMVSATKKTRFN